MEKVFELTEGRHYIIIMKEGYCTCHNCIKIRFDDNVEITKGNEDNDCNYFDKEITIKATKSFTAYIYIPMTFRTKYKWIKMKGAS